MFVENKEERNLKVSFIIWKISDFCRDPFPFHILLLDHLSLPPNSIEYRDKGKCCALP